MRDPKILKHPGLQPLWDGLQAEWKQQQYLAIALLVGGVAGITYGASTVSLLLLFVSGVGAFLALFWLFRLSSRKPVSEVYHLLLEEADGVRWVYGMVTERLPFGLSFSASAIVYLFLEDGTEISTSVPADKVKLVVKTLSRALPQAEIGYTEERELKYRGEVVGKRFSWWREE